jgi:hypothetical protein
MTLPNQVPDEKQPDAQIKATGGSMKRQVINPDLQEERDKCIFDQRELERFIVGDKKIAVMKKVSDDVRKHPELKSDFSWYDMSKQ